MSISIEAAVGITAAILAAVPIGISGYKCWKHKTRRGYDRSKVLRLLYKIASITRLGLKVVRGLMTCQSGAIQKVEVKRITARPTTDSS